MAEDNTVTIDGTTYEFVVQDRRTEVSIGGSPSERAESLARLAEIVKAWDERKADRVVSLESD